MRYLFNSPSKLLGAFLCVFLASGCATNNNLYAWGSYETQVYARFKNNENPEAQIQAIENDLQTLNGQKPIAPGFHAHLGLLYGEAGRTAEMREQLLIEKRLFPESTQFMDFLLAKMDQRQGAKQ
jgi:hypothetical protein